MNYINLTVLTTYGTSDWLRVCILHSDWLFKMELPPLRPISESVTIEDTNSSESNEIEINSLNTEIDIKEEPEPENIRRSVETPDPSLE